eukprot:GABW01005114.1.p2 GENE.GABW01005114.1~~GABW01005114.1.p2  ORF type:complete len:77 (-),score=29.38 GABW01005114.1:177-407(-)
MIPAGEARESGDQEVFNKMLTLPVHDEIYDPNTMKGAQSSPYLSSTVLVLDAQRLLPLKFITQMFGDEMYIANMAG